MTSILLPLAGTGFNLNNTNFVVLIAFLLFIAVLVFLKVPGKVGSLLDARAERIRSELEEARALREEAQTLLASYERKQREVAEQAESIVTSAKAEAENAAKEAKAGIEESVARRLQAALDRITSAEQSAVKEVQDGAVNVAVRAAQQVIADNLKANDANKLIDEAIKDVGARLH